MKETKHAVKSSGTAKKTLPGLLMALAMLASQIVVIPTAYSAFRLSKSVVFLIVVGLAAVLWSVGRAGKTRLVISPLTGVLAVYPLLLAASALWAPLPAKALVAAGTAAIWVFGLLLLLSLNEDELRRAGWWAVVGGSLSAAVALGQVAGVSPFQLSGVKGRLRIVGLAGNPSDVAAACVIILPLLLIGIDDARRRWPRALAGGVLVAGVIAAQSRAGLAALFLEGLVFFAWLASRHVSKRGLVAGGAITVVLLAAGIWAAVPRIEWTLEVARKQGILSAINRDGGWTAASVMIGEHPWLGVGGNGFNCLFAPARLTYLKVHDRVGYRRIGFASHFPNAHDDPLQTVAELGVFGLGWLIALGIAVVRIRPWRMLPLRVAMAGLVPFLFFHYPCHISVALAPMMLLAAWAIRTQQPEPGAVALSRSRWLVTFVVLAVTVPTAWVSVRTLRLDVWRKNANLTLDLVEVRTRQGRLPVKARQALLTGLDTEGSALLGQVPGADAWLWRIIGLSRLGRGDAAGAETAFRRSLETCPHEEAYLGLGVALLDEGRANEAFGWLCDACRIDPNLARTIPDPTFRQTVLESIGASR